MQDGKAVAAYFTYFGSLLLLKLSDEKKIFPVTVESIFHNAHCLCLYISISWFIEDMLFDLILISNSNSLQTK